MLLARKLLLRAGYYRFPRMLPLWWQRTGYWQAATVEELTR
jgi:hypothetical protein